MMDAVGTVIANETPPRVLSKYYRISSAKRGAIPFAGPWDCYASRRSALRNDGLDCILNPCIPNLASCILAFPAIRKKKSLRNGRDSDNVNESKRTVRGSFSVHRDDFLLCFVEDAVLLPDLGERVEGLFQMMDFVRG
jgi:hypothetical protein